MALPFAVGAMLGGSAMNALGNLYAGEMAAKAGEYNAQIAEQNARLARQQAQIDAQKVGVMGEKAIGSIRASVGASGLAMDGSALDVLQDSAATAAVDKMMVQYQGEMRAIAFENEAKLARFGGQAARIGSYFGAASSLGQGAYAASSYGGTTAPTRGGPSGSYGSAGQSYKSYGNVG